jgi:hypothetical protein
MSRKKTTKHGKAEENCEILSSSKKNIRYL